MQDLTRPGTNPYFGRYYRVSESGRNPETGAWGIRWSLDTDEIVRPEGEPIYRFDGSTWDLPAEANTVFPKATFIVTSVIAAILMLSAGIFWSDPVDVIGMRVFGLLLVVCVTGWNWFYNLEPVRGTKVGALITAASAARSAQNKRESRERIAEYNRNSEVLKWIDSLDPERARQAGFTQRRRGFDQEDV